MAQLMLGAATIFILAKHILFNGENEKKNNRNYLIFVWVVLILILGTRNGEINYGSDLNTYYRTFQQAIVDSRENFFSTSTFEGGYLWLNWLLARVIKWPQFIIIFQAAFCCGITLRFIYKHTDSVVLAVLGFMAFGILQFYMTGFRQSFAICICLLALEMAEKKKWIFYIIITLLASFFHQTAVVFFLIPLLLKNKNKKLYFLLDILFVIILSQVVPRLLVVGNNIFERNYIMAYQGNLLGGVINIVIGMLTVCIVFLQTVIYDEPGMRIQYKKSETRIKREKNYRLVHILLVGIGIYTLRYQALVLERISMYFTPILFVLFPEVLHCGFTYESRRFVKVCSAVGMLFLIYWRMRTMEYIPFWG